MDNEVDGEVMLSSAQASAIVGVNEDTIRALVDSGQLAAVRTAGGHRRIPLSKAKQMAQQRHAAMHEPGPPDVEGLAAVKVWVMQQMPAMPAALHDPVLVPLDLLDSIEESFPGTRFRLLAMCFLSRSVDGFIRALTERTNDSRQDARNLGEKLRDCLPNRWAVPWQRGVAIVWNIMVAGLDLEATARALLQLDWKELGRGRLDTDPAGAEHVKAAEAVVERAQAELAAAKLTADERAQARFAELDGALDEAGLVTYAQWLARLNGAVKADKAAAAAFKLIRTDPGLALLLDDPAGVLKRAFGVRSFETVLKLDRWSGSLDLERNAQLAIERGWERLAEAQQAEAEAPEGEAETE